MRMTKEEYASLKQTPLALEDPEPEMLAIWADTYGLDFRSLKSILYSVFNYRHHQVDEIGTKSHPLSTNFNFHYLEYEYFSDRAIKNIFVLMFKTNAIDDIILTSRFVEFVLRQKNECAKVLGQLKKIYMKRIIVEDEFEVWAEMLDRLNGKMKEKEK